MKKLRRAAFLGMIVVAVFFLSGPCSHGDTVWVSLYTENVLELNSSGNPLSSRIFPGTSEGVTSDRKGNLYVACDNNKIYEFNSNGVESVFATTGLNNPVGLAFDSSGNLYAANFGNNTIEEFGTNGVGSLFANTGLYEPAGLAFDSSGNLYVANYMGGIVRFDTNGVVSMFAPYSSDMAQPAGLAFDSNGNLYVASHYNNIIEKFSASGVGSVFADSGLSAPLGLAFDRSGNLYVANNGSNLIEKFDTNGVGSVFASAGTLGFGASSVPRFIAVQFDEQIPEPATWGLVALGAVTLVGGRQLCRRWS